MGERFEATNVNPFNGLRKLCHSLKHIVSVRWIVDNKTKSRALHIATKETEFQATESTECGVDRRWRQQHIHKHTLKSSEACSCYHKRHKYFTLFTIYSDGDNFFSVRACLRLTLFWSHTHSLTHRLRCTFTRTPSIRHTNVYKNVLFTATREFGMFCVRTVCWCRLREPLVNLVNEDRKEEKSFCRLILRSVRSNLRIRESSHSRNDRERVRERKKCKRYLSVVNVSNERNENCVLWLVNEQSAKCATIPET